MAVQFYSSGGIMNHPRIVLIVVGFVVCTSVVFSQQTTSTRLQGTGTISVDVLTRTPAGNTPLPRLGTFRTLETPVNSNVVTIRPAPSAELTLKQTCLSRTGELLPVTDNAIIRGGVFSTKGIPMIGASAYLYPGDIHVPIREDGSYEVTRLLPGSYSVTIVHPGYHLYMSTVTAKEEFTKGTVLLMRRTDEVNEMDTIKRELDRVQRICAHGFKTKQPIVSTPPTPEVTTERAGTLVLQTPPMLEQAPIIAGDNHELHAEDLVTEVTVLPNPAQETATINFALANESKVLLEVFSLESGQRVMLLDLGQHKAGDNNTRININNLARGTYSVLVRASSCQYALTTFIKE